MFIPNQTALLHRKIGRNVFGKVTFAAPVSIGVSIVTLDEKVEQSAIRADSSASHAASDITALKAKLLVEGEATIAEDDVIEILGQKVQVAGIEPRANVLGDVDHYEVTGNLKAEL
jgi:hypothetical protein